MKIHAPVVAHSIEIIDSIPLNEGQTARRLYDQMKDWQYEESIPQCLINHHLVPDVTSFQTLLSKLSVAAAKGAWPLIHIESHGDETGLLLADGDFMKWTDVQSSLLSLNKATRNHLFVVVAACWGFNGIRAMLSRADHAACFRLLAGPAEVATSGAIEDGMKDFYRSILTNGDVMAAIDCARAHLPALRIFSAEEAFIAGWAKFQNGFPTTNKEIQKKADGIVSEVKAQNPNPPNRLHSRAKKAIREMGRDMSIPFNNYKQRFFMLDLFPEISPEFEQIKLSGGAGEEGEISTTL